MLQCNSPLTQSFLAAEMFFGRQTKDVGFSLQGGSLPWQPAEWHPLAHSTDFREQGGISAECAHPFPLGCGGSADNPKRGVKRKLN